MNQLTGIGVSSGLAIGAALVTVQGTRVIRFPISPDRIARELSRLDRARIRSQEQLEQIRDRVATQKGRDLAAIFDAQILMLDDPLLLGRASAIVKDERVNAEWAVQRAIDELADVLNDLPDPYLRERKGDLHDVSGRLRMNVRGEQGGIRGLLDDLDAPCVLIADELMPSVVAQMDWDRIGGFATDAGSRTYHTAILARSLGVPAVVGLHDVSLRVPPGATVIIDGDTGQVTINPHPELRREAETRGRPARPRSQAQYPLDSLCTTSDGVRIVLHANIERSEDVARALASGAEGIGLFRSEFLLGGGPPEMAGEDEQYDEYRRVVEQMGSRTVTIRTFDIDERQLTRPPVDAGHDRHGGQDAGRGGRAGLRGIRLSLAYPGMFKIQLCALLRAAAHGSLRILFPFVSSVREVRAARIMLAEAQADLEARGLAGGHAAVGIMIEVPSAAFVASLLAREADFFTIGTNDLIQYTLAVDRTDERVSDRYQPLHPAVLRLLRQVRRGAARQNIPVSVCGEMASDPLLLPLLIGCGLKEFSMTPDALPKAKLVIHHTNAGEMGRIAARVLTLGTVDDIEQFLLDTLGHRYVPTEVSTL